MNMKKTLKKGAKKGDGDREKQIRKALLECDTPEEALLIRCSHFDQRGIILKIKELQK